MVFGISNSLFVLEEASAAGISIFATSATSSCIGRYGRGVFNSTSGFSFCGIAVGDESGGWFGLSCDLRTNFRISTNVVFILCANFIKIEMIFAVDNCPLILMSLSKRRALFKTLPRFSTTSRIHSRLSVCTHSWRISLSFFAISILNSATLDDNAALAASEVDVSYYLSFFNSLIMFLGLQPPRSLEALFVTNSNLESLQLIHLFPDLLEGIVFKIEGCHGDHFPIRQSDWLSSLKYQKQVVQNTPLRCSKVIKSL